MHCLKCGRESDEKQVFCKSCLDEIDKYPVKPGTSVYIPPPPVEQPEKKPINAPRRRTLEEKNQQLQLVVRILLWLLAVLILFSIFSTMLIVHLMNKQDQTPIGQNFGTASYQETEEMSSDQVSGS